MLVFSILNIHIEINVELGVYIFVLTFDTFEENKKSYPTLSQPEVKHAPLLNSHGVS